MQGDRHISYSLISAVRAGRLERVRELINSFGLSDLRSSSDGYVLLCDALKNNRTEIAKLLLTNGSKVNSIKKNPSVTPLHLAVRNGAIEIIEMLLDRGANIDAECERSRVPLHDAVRWDKMEIVELLLNRGADVNAKGKYGKTSLHIAADAGYLPIVEHLLKHGADVNSECSYARNKHCTPLYNAVINGFEKVVKLLLEYGANVDAQDQNGKTILYFAVEKGHSLIVEHLLKYCPDVNNTSNRSTFYITLRYSGEEYDTIAKNLLKYGFTINLEYGDNCKLLHGAVEKGHSKTVEELIKCGVSINSKDTRGKTALHIASEKSNLKMVEVLLKYGARVNSKDEHGRTALHTASNRENLEIVEVLLKFGAIDSTDIYGITALNIAWKNWTPQVAITLLDHGSDITIMSKRAYLSRSFAEIFDRHAVKVKTANLYVRNKNLLSIRSNEKLNKFRHLCEKEVASMKSEKVGNANISFYDILTKGISQLAIYAGNESIVQVFGSDYYKMKFPIYATLMSSNFRKGERRKELVERGDKIFHLFFTNFLGIPYDCTEKLFNYLSDEDLRSIIDACNPISLSSLNTDNK